MSKENKSYCCNASVVIEGKVTKYYICTKCGYGCDLKKQLLNKE